MLWLQKLFVALTSSPQQFDKVTQFMILLYFRSMIYSFQD